MKLNKYKTECLLLGSLKGTANEIFQIKVNENSVKSLGILYIGHSKNRMPLKKMNELSEGY